MALKIQHIPTIFSISPITISTHKKLITRISCIKNNNNKNNNTSLEAEFAEKASIINARVKQAEEAMRKSRKLLFLGFSEYLDLKEEETKEKWKNLSEDEKWVLIKGFVAEWSEFFHPLSSRATKEMVEEYLLQENLPPKDSNFSSPLFPFDSIIGLP